MTFSLLILCTSIGLIFENDSHPQIIPEPVKMEISQNKLLLSDIKEIEVGLTPSVGIYKIAKMMSQWSHLKIVQKSESTVAIRFFISKDISKSNEGYRLSIDKNGVLIQANCENGIFYGMQSLRQLLATSAKSINYLEIEDYPQYKWRGMHLDVSRHFFDKNFVKKYLDVMARHKLNVFHWHLVDGPGWRLPSVKYPKLTEIGAWRKDQREKPWNWRATSIDSDGKNVPSYGGFYTVEDIQEILNYAKERFIMVIPEIEMPGHSYAALVAYPQFACKTNNVVIDGLRGKDVFCIGKENVFEFLKNILEETIHFFPESPFIHFGGDEVSEISWNECPDCQEKRKQLNLKPNDKLQNYFTNRMVDEIEKMGKRAIGWDEVALNSTLSKKTIVMVWRDAKFAKAAADHGNEVVLTPISHFYLNMRPSDNLQKDPFGEDGVISLQKCYQFNPQSYQSEKHPEKLLGIQGCLWTEHIQTPAQAEYLLLPRMSAMAEIAWTPATKLSWTRFQKNMHPLMSQLEKEGYTIRKESEKFAESAK